MVCACQRHPRNAAHDYDHHHCHSFRTVILQARLDPVSLACLLARSHARLSPAPLHLRDPFPLASAPSQDLHPGPPLIRLVLVIHLHPLPTSVLPPSLLLPPPPLVLPPAASVAAGRCQFLPAGPFSRQYRSPCSSCLIYTSLPKSDSAVDEPHFRPPNPNYPSLTRPTCHSMSLLHPGNIISPGEIQ
jgi:hypothetical protein